MALQNLRHLKVGLKAKPLERGTLALDYHQFELDESKDTWHRTNRSDCLPGGGSSTEMGQGIDVNGSYPWRSN